MAIKKIYIGWDDEQEPCLKLVTLADDQPEFKIWAKTIEKINGSNIVPASVLHDIPVGLGIINEKKAECELCLDRGETEIDFDGNTKTCICQTGMILKPEKETVSINNKDFVLNTYKLGPDELSEGE